MIPFVFSNIVVFLLRSTHQPQPYTDLLCCPRNDQFPQHYLCYQFVFSHFFMLSSHVSCIIICLKSFSFHILLWSFLTFLHFFTHFCAQLSEAYNVLYHCMQSDCSLGTADLFYKCDRATWSIFHHFLTNSIFSHIYPFLLSHFNCSFSHNLSTHSQSTWHFIHLVPKPLEVFQIHLVDQAPFCHTEIAPSYLDYRIHCIVHICRTWIYREEDNGCMSCVVASGIKISYTKWSIMIHAF